MGDGKTKQMLEKGKDKITMGRKQRLFNIKMKKIKVGNFKFDLMFKDDINIEPEVNLCGYVNHKSKKIFIQNPDVFKNETIFHEIAHIIIRMCSEKSKENRYILLKLNNDEKFITNLSKILYKTFKLK